MPVSWNCTFFPVVIYFKIQLEAKNIQVFSFTLCHLAEMAFYESEF